jgi:hypothetical protein
MEMDFWSREVFIRVVFVGSWDVFGHEVTRC